MMPARMIHSKEADEQSRIVAKVVQRMAWVDALKTQLAASLATVANLLSALVALVAELTAT